MKFRKLTAGLLSLVLSFSLAACNTDTSGDNTDTSANQGEVEENVDSGKEDESNGEKVEITFIPSKVEAQEQFEEIAKTYNESQDKTEITTLGVAGDSITTVLQSNFAADPASAPTIFAISGPSASGFERFFADLSDMEAAKKLSESFTDEVTNDEGQIVGLPSAVEGYGFIYNVQMFEDAGIDPKSLDNMDDFVAALKTLSEVDGVESPIAFSEEEYFLFIHFFNWAVALEDNYQDVMAEVNAGEKKLSDLDMVQKWAKALDEIKPYTNGGLNTYDEQVAGFANGKFAMIHQGNWAQSVLEDNNVDFEYDYLPYPLDGNTALAVGTSNAWRVNNKASEAQQTAAKEFLDWLITSDEGQKLSAEKLGFIPAYKDVQVPEGGLSEAVSAYVNDANTVDWAFNSVFPAGIEVDGARLMQDYYADRITSDELLEELSTTWADRAK